jgi:hypothetical protein
MTRYAITFDDGSFISICLDYEPQAGEIFSGGMFGDKTIATVTEVV